MSRSKVLDAFRSLHRARKEVFKGDSEVLEAARLKINEEFRKHAGETDMVKVNKLLGIAEESESLLRKTVVQAQLKQDGTYELNITKDTLLENNTIFDPCADLPVRGKRKKSCNSEDTNR